MLDMTGVGTAQVSTGPGCGIRTYVRTHVHKTSLARGHVTFTPRMASKAILHPSVAPAVSPRTSLPCLLITGLVVNLLKIAGNM